MQRRTIILVLLAAFAISLFTSAAAGAVAGVVAVRMSASDRAATRTNGAPSTQVQPNPANPANPAQPSQRQPGQGRFGAGGALISEVVAGSPAEKAGVQVGDLVIAIGSQRLDATHTLDAVIRQSKVGDTVDLQLRRSGNGTQTVSVTLAASPTDPTAPYLGVRFSVAPSGNPTNPTPVAPNG